MKSCAYRPNKLFVLLQLPVKLTGNLKLLPLYLFLLNKTSPGRLNHPAGRYNTLKTNLHTFNKILKRSISSAKKVYYNKVFNQYKFNIRKTWGTIKDIY